MGYGRKYTQEEHDFIKKYYKGRSNKELTEMFNHHFGLDLKVSQIKSYKNNRHWDSGLTGRFEKANRPWNKGLKGLDIGGKETQFKKGSIPPNYRPVGSERINSDDYVEVKVADPGIWKMKHVVVWEKEYGRVPKGKLIIFGDGNRRNFDINNLLLVSRKQLLKLNQHHLIANHADLTKTGLMIADIYSKIGERKKR